MRKPAKSSERNKKSPSREKKDTFKKKDSGSSKRSEKPKSRGGDLNNEERPAEFYAKAYKSDKKDKAASGGKKAAGKFAVKPDVTKKSTPVKSGKPKFLTPQERQKKVKGDPLPSFSEDIRLNKYLSNAGICSRREADVLIQTGLVKVNGTTITELGYKVKPGDEVKYDGGTVRAEKKRYVLLNKPKDFITTMDDPMDRKTVMVLVAKACKERIYPVGRLDRNTTGLLLFTNDGDLAKRLTHPRYEVRKLYHVETVEPVTYEQINRLLEGVELDDGGFVKADKVEILKDSKNREVGIEIHSGKYRVVRRMFEAIGHVVKKLDRVSFAGLTKKDLPRGNYRHLTEDEVNFLRML